MPSSSGLKTHVGLRLRGAAILGDGFDGLLIFGTRFLVSMVEWLRVSGQLGMVFSSSSPLLSRRRCVRRLVSSVRLGWGFRR